MLRYENPWRPNYEAAAVSGWVVIGAFSWGTADLWGLHEAPFRYLAGFAVLMMLAWLPGAMRQWQRRSRLRGRPLTFLPPSTLERILRRDPERLWLGWVMSNVKKPRTPGILRSAQTDLAGQFHEGPAHARFRQTASGLGEEEARGERVRAEDVAPLGIRLKYLLGRWVNRQVA
jgi:hypothetical protein